MWNTKCSLLFCLFSPKFLFFYFLVSFLSFVSVSLLFARSFTCAGYIFNYFNFRFPFLFIYFYFILYFHSFIIQPIFSASFSSLLFSHVLIYPFPLLPCSVVFFLLIFRSFCLHSFYGSEGSGVFYFDKRISGLSVTSCKELFSSCWVKSNDALKKLSATDISLGVMPTDIHDGGVSLSSLPLRVNSCVFLFGRCNLTLFQNGECFGDLSRARMLPQKMRKTEQIQIKDTNRNHIVLIQRCT